MITRASQHIEIGPSSGSSSTPATPRKNDSAVDRMCASIREFGFKIPILARSDGEVVDGHLRLKAARKLGIAEVPVMLCDEWTPAQVKTFRLMVNRSVTWANPGEIDKLLVLEDEEKANATPPLPENAVSRTVGAHRIVCGDATTPRLLLSCWAIANPD